MKNKILKLLNPKQKLGFLLLILLIFIGSVMEMLSIAIIIPLINITVNDNFNLFLLNDFVKNLIKKEIITYVSFCIIIIFLFKNIYLMFLKSKIENYLFNLKHELSLKVYKNILFQDYEVFIKKNTSHFSSIVLNVVSELVSNIFSNLIFLFNEILVLFLIIVLLFFYSPLTTLAVVIIFSFLFFFIYSNTKKKLVELSKTKIYHEARQIKTLNESFRLIMYSKVLSIEDFFIKQFLEHNKKVHNISKKLTLIEYVPNLITEVSVVLLIIILMLFINYQNYNFKEFISLIIIFVLAALRLRPSIGKIINCFQKIKYGKESLNVYFENVLNNINGYYSSTIKQKLEKNLEIRNLNFSYGDKKIFNDFNLIINKGDFVGISGKTGSGKSTLINLIIGLLKPESGTFFLDDKDINNQNLYQLIKVGFVPQEIFLIDDTIAENILLLEEYDEKKLNEVIKLSGVGEFLSGLPNGKDTLVGENGVFLSGGQKQRIGLARSLVRNPDLLILDEATNALDFKIQMQIYKNLKETKVTTLIISHQINNFKYCSKVVSI
jgi:ABC-type multidrug transport system fused ATPase/permease subunit